jgi:hypothetical protein
MADGDKQVVNLKTKVLAQTRKYVFTAGLYARVTVKKGFNIAEFKKVAVVHTHIRVVKKSKNYYADHQDLAVSGMSVRVLIPAYPDLSWRKC